VNIGEVGRALGVRYVLESSVRKAGNRVRINAQLIEAATGGHVWAERYDRELTDIFAVQDDLRQKIVRALEVKLSAQEQAHAGLIPTHNIEAYDHFLRGLEYFWQMTKVTNLRARQQFERALALDPKYAAATAFLSFTDFAAWFYTWSSDPQLLDRALTLGQRAIALDNALAEAYMILGLVYVFKKQPEQAIAAGERAITLNPNLADGYVWLGFVLSFIGKLEEALVLGQQALRLNPMAPFSYFVCLGHTFYLLRRYDEATAALQKSIVLNPTNAGGHILLALSSIESDRIDQARSAILSGLRLSPLASPQRLRQRLPHTDPTVVKRMVKSTSKALATLRVRDYIWLVKARVLQHFCERRTRDHSLR